MLLEHSIILLKKEIKHMPGRHDQMSHGRRFGKLSYTSPLHENDSQVRSSQLSAAYKDQIDALSPEQTKAIRTYTGDSYEPMNGQLRYGNGSYTTNTLKEQIATATEGLNTGRAPFAFKTLRGIDIADPDTMFNDLTKKVGKTFVDPAFVSTTANMNTSFFGSDIRFQVHVPKGARGLYVNDISYSQNEREFLIPPGSRFKVLKTEIDQYGKRVVSLGLATQPNKKKA